jgi:hypothetical protein
MTKEKFWKIYEAVQRAGYQTEVDWSENLKPCDTSSKFLSEYIWVILNSGMKNQVARLIFDRIREAIATGQPISRVFKHKGKVDAILNMSLVADEIFEAYQKSEDKLSFLDALSFIGKVTKYHLAKNLGVDICKPDRHLVRIADYYKTTPQALCEKLSEGTGMRIATVDVILWRAANLGLKELWCVK